jgi:Xaa-Pro aminopeptidase
MLVGNEGLDYARRTSSNVEILLCQSLSLLAQSRVDAPRLDDALRLVGLTQGAVGVVGWKYLTAAESDEPDEPAFVPAFIVSTLRRISGHRPVDSTRHLMDAESGMRASNSGEQIAAFEWGAARASAAVMRLVAGTKPGMSELEAASLSGYAGESLSCHMMLSADDVAVTGLRSPGSRIIRNGEAITGAIGYAGGLRARAGVMAATPDGRFFDGYVAPYFRALVAWYDALCVGVSGAVLREAVLAAIGEAPFAPMLNPGHLGSFDEWVNSPIYAGSTQTIRPGMVLQCDIIPTPTPTPSGRALNCEDTVAVADTQLRDKLARDHPELWARIGIRRDYIRSQLGIELGDDVLPLSDSVGYLAPLWRKPSLVCRADGP